MYAVKLERIIGSSTLRQSLNGSCLIAIIDVIKYHDSNLIPNGGSHVENCGDDSLYGRRQEGAGAVEQEQNRRGAQGGASEDYSAVPCWKA
jgi:hypothetical protein